MTLGIGNALLVLRIVELSYIIMFIYRNIHINKNYIIALTTKECRLCKGKHVNVSSCVVQLLVLRTTQSGLHPLPGRYVRINTNSTFLGIIKPHCNYYAKIISIYPQQTMASEPVNRETWSERN